jgi:hypothetical protein
LAYNEHGPSCFEEVDEELRELSQGSQHHPQQQAPQVRQDLQQQQQVQVQ